MENLFDSVIGSPEFATFVVSIIASIVGGVFAFVGKALRDLLKTRLSAEELKALMEIARHAVAVAEQTGVAATGAQKKEEAMRIAATFLQAYGLKVSAEQLSAAIEAAVWAELSKWEEPLVPESVVTATEAAEG